jgi:hypothetical protein
MALDNINIGYALMDKILLVFGFVVAVVPSNHLFVGVFVVFVVFVAFHNSCHNIHD